MPRPDAGERTRTSKDRSPPGPKPGASTSSATPATRRAYRALPDGQECGSCLNPYMARWRSSAGTASASRSTSRRTSSSTRSSTRPPTSPARSRSPASARARCRARCSSRTSARTGSGSRRSSRHIGGWFWNAAARSRLRPVAPPEYDYELPTSETSRGVQRDGRGAADARDRRLDDARGAARRAEVPEELVEHGARGAAQLGRRARPGRRPAGAARATRSSSTSPAPTARRQRDTVVELGSRPARRRDRERARRRRASARRSTSRYELADGTETTGRGHASRTSTRRCCRSSTTSSRARPASSTRSPSCAPTSRAACAQRSRSEIDAAFRAAAVDELVDAPRTSRRAGPLVEARARELLERLRPLARATAGSTPETYFAGDRPDARAARPRRSAPRRRSPSRASSCSRRSPTRPASRSPTTRSKDADPRAGRGVGRRPGGGDRRHLGARPPGVAARGPAPARRARPARRRGEADRRSSSRRARGDLDARQGEARDRDEIVDPRKQGESHEPPDPDGDRADLARRARRSTSTPAC